MRFADRAEAGRALGVVLRDGPLAQERRRLVLLAIPRGGVPVATQVAQVLDAPLDVVVTRKLRAPGNPELAIGAVAADGHVEINQALVRRLGLSEETVAAELADRHHAVRERVRHYRAIVDEADLAGAVAIVIDDGVATGATARMACRTARRMGAARVVLATPVGPEKLEETLEDAADDVVVLLRPVPFVAVGQGYLDFAQITDDQVTQALVVAAGR